MEEPLTTSPVETKAEVVSLEKMYDILVAIQNKQSELEKRLNELKTEPSTETEEQGKVVEVQDTEELVGAIDQGTTSSRFLIFNKRGEPIASHQVEFNQIYPHPGFVSTPDLASTRTIKANTL